MLQPEEPRRDREEGAGAGPRGASSPAQPTRARSAALRTCGMRRRGGGWGVGESTPGCPRCPGLKDRGDIFTPQTAAPPFLPPPPLQPPSP